jgi:hypothetical protein
MPLYKLRDLWYNNCISAAVYKYGVPKTPYYLLLFTNYYLTHY